MLSAVSLPVWLVHHLTQEAKLVLIFPFLKRVTISSRGTPGAGGGGGRRGAASVSSRNASSGKRCGEGKGEPAGASGGFLAQVDGQRRSRLNRCDAAIPRTCQERRFSTKRDVRVFREGGTHRHLSVFIRIPHRAALRLPHPWEPARPPAAGGSVAGGSARARF